MIANPASEQIIPATKPITKVRLQSVDALRGLIMIIMALDHTRDFFHTIAPQFQPDDLTRTTAALFFTRWITHFCAPVFMFTAGIGAFFWGRRHTKAQLSEFLLKRGLWLALLEITIVRYAITFHYFRGPFIITILWGLGWAMVALALLVHLPVRVLAPLSLAVIATHNLLDGITMWPGFHQLAPFQVRGVLVLITYTLIPWFAVMAAGYCFGTILTLPPDQRRQWMIRIGSAATLAFVVIRFINIYGDPVRWSHKFPLVLSFLRVNKYPPSLDFLLMTLGPAILLLALFDRMEFSVTNPMIVFGRVPLFYFVLHLYILHGLGVFFPTASLPIVYAWWIAVVIALYPLCLWFSRVKQNRRDWWLSYV